MTLEHVLDRDWRIILLRKPLVSENNRGPLARPKLLMSAITRSAMRILLH